ncbi:MAG: hypothetical protein JXP34_23565 [Planctomycetes bacterium]|nr:hypothetical protein [Planctomycetota bacterium]
MARMMTRNRTVVALALAAALAGAFVGAGGAWAAGEEGEGDESPFSGSFGVLFANKYVWRGILMTDDGVLQPSLTLGAYGASVNVWGNLDLTDYGRESGGYGNHAGEFSEIDTTIDYTYAVGPVGLSAGHIQYSFPDTSIDTTNEIYGGVSLDTILHPTVKLYYDYDEVDGLYATGGVSQTIPLVQDRPITVGLALAAQIGLGFSGYVEDYFGTAHEGSFTDLIISASLPIGLVKYVTVMPTVAFTALLDQPFRDSVRHPDNLIVGISVGVAF